MNVTTKATTVAVAAEVITLGRVRGTLGKPEQTEAEAEAEAEAAISGMKMIEVVGES
tara:strand:- start:46 stop:216 length:171 start_codon:yes stop_codon:yes gene_type:complete